MSTPRVVSVSRDETHGFSKHPVDAIELVAGIGVIGDAHAGTLVQHRYDVRKDPNRRNLRQVHLIQSELFDEVRERGHEVGAGDLGENVTTAGIDLLALPAGTRLDLGGPVVRLTGLRQPCVLINRFQAGLMKVLIEKVDGETIRKAGVMWVVERGGEVRPGAPITVSLPGEPHHPMVPV